MGISRNSGRFRNPITHKQVEEVFSVKSHQGITFDIAITL